MKQLFLSLIIINTVVTLFGNGEPIDNDNDAVDIITVASTAS